MTTNELQAWFSPHWPDNSTIMDFGSAIMGGWWGNLSEHVSDLPTSPDGLVDIYLVDVQTRLVKLPATTSTPVNSTAWFTFDLTTSELLSTELWTFVLVAAGAVYSKSLDYVRSPYLSVRDTESSSTSSATRTSAETTSTSETTAMITSANPIVSSIASSAISSATSGSTSARTNASPSLSNAAIAGIIVASVVAGAILMVVCLAVTRYLRSKKDTCSTSVDGAASAPELGQPQHEGLDANSRRWSTECKEMEQPHMRGTKPPTHELGIDSTATRIAPLSELWAGRHS